MSYTDKVFTEGMIFKLPSEKAPDYVKGSISIKVDEFIAFAEKNKKNGWLNVNLKVGKSGKAYAELDTWEPKKTETKEEINTDSIPF